MSTERTGAHSADDPDPGLGSGGITGRDGTHITDTELDAWIDAFAVPDAATPMPPGTRRSTTSAETTVPVTDHHPQPPSRDICGNVVGDITHPDGTVESVDALNAWANAFETADTARPLQPPTDPARAARHAAIRGEVDVEEAAAGHGEAGSGPTVANEVLKAPCGLTQGSSGGPWLEAASNHRQGFVGGIISRLNQGSPKQSLSPFLGARYVGLICAVNDLQGKHGAFGRCSAN